MRPEGHEANAPLDQIDSPQPIWPGRNPTAFGPPGGEGMGKRDPGPDFIGVCTIKIKPKPTINSPAPQAYSGNPRQLSWLLRAPQTIVEPSSIEGRCILRPPSDAVDGALLRFKPTSGSTAAGLSQHPGRCWQEHPPPSDSEKGRPRCAHTQQGPLLNTVTPPILQQGCLSAGLGSLSKTRVGPHTRGSRLTFPLLFLLPGGLLPLPPDDRQSRKVGLGLLGLPR